MCLAKFSFTVDDEYFVSLSNNHVFDENRYTDTRRKQVASALQTVETASTHRGAQLTAEWNNTTEVHSLQLNGTKRLRCTDYN